MQSGKLPYKRKSSDSGISETSNTSYDMKCKPKFTPGEPNEKREVEDNMSSISNNNGVESNLFLPLFPLNFKISTTNSKRIVEPPPTPSTSNNSVNQSDYTDMCSVSQQESNFSDSSDEYDIEDSNEGYCYPLDEFEHIETPPPTSHKDRIWARKNIDYGVLNIISKMDIFSGAKLVDISDSDVGDIKQSINLKRKLPLGIKAVAVKNEFKCPLPVFNIHAPRRASPLEDHRLAKSCTVLKPSQVNPDLRPKINALRQKFLKTKEIKPEPVVEDDDMLSVYVTNDWSEMQSQRDVTSPPLPVSPPRLCTPPPAQSPPSKKFKHPPLPPQIFSQPPPPLVYTPPPPLVYTPPPLKYTSPPPKYTPPPEKFTESPPPLKYTEPPSSPTYKLKITRSLVHANQSKQTPCNPDTVLQSQPQNMDENVRNWIPENNENPIELLKSLSAGMQTGNLKECSTEYLNLETSLSSAIALCTPETLQQFQKCLKDLKMPVLFKKFFPMIIGHHQEAENNLELIVCVGDILNQRDINKTRMINLVVNALTSLTTYNYSSAVNDILQAHGLLNNTLSDILLALTCEQIDFITKYWTTVTSLTKLKYEIDHGVLEDILNAALKVNTVDVLEQVCKDLLLKEHIQLGKVDKILVNKFVSALEQNNLPQFAYLVTKSISNVAQNDTPLVSQSSPVASYESPSFISPGKQNIISESEMKDLVHCLSVYDSDMFASLIIKNKSEEMRSDVLINTIVILRSKEMVFANFHSFFKDVMKKLEKCDDDVYNILAHIAFNVIALYSTKMNWTLAAEIISLFFEHIDMLIKVKCVVEPFKSNTNEQSRLIFLIEMFMKTRGLYLVLELITNDSFTWPVYTKGDMMFETKKSLIKEFLNAAMKKDTSIARQMFKFLFTKKMQHVQYLDIAPEYNKYLMNKVKAEDSAIKAEFKETIKMGFALMDTSTLREYLPRLYAILNIAELKDIFDHACKKGLFMYLNSCSQIDLHSNMTILEMQIQISMTLLNILLKRYAPKALHIVIRPRSNYNTMQQAYNNVREALKSFFVPMYKKDKNIFLSQQEVKRCLEAIRRSVPNNYYFS